jgi:[protein-PII] uridylyltransferase
VRALLAHVSIPEGVALVAVGGYGRRELSPKSDLDLLLTFPRRCPSDLADQVWYPLWDAGVKLGHAVRSVSDTLKLAKGDLDTATALLDTRPILGDERIATELVRSARKNWHRHGPAWLTALARAGSERHARFDDVAFAIEPDVKQGRGGLRDAQALRWAALAGSTMNVDLSAIPDAVDSLTVVRNALHLVTARASDQVLIESIDEVAASAGFPDRDDMMAAVAAAARTISWASDEVFYDVDPKPTVRLDDPVVEANRGRVRLRAGVEVSDVALALHIAGVAARAGCRIDAQTLEQMADIDVPTPWPADVRDAFIELLACGRAAIPVIEALDHAGVWTRLLPEWEPARSRPQHNPYHGYTVDRHLLETVAIAAKLTSPRPDLLLLGALLHDLGKAYAGDHSVVGAEMVPQLVARMGFPPEDVETVAVLVREHLLLPDTAIRRDLDDPATLVAVAELVPRRETLSLLSALALADGQATGPTAWSDWKAKLVEELVTRVGGLLDGAEATEVVSDTPFSTEVLELAQSAPPGEIVIRGAGHQLTVTAPDRPGLFSRITGATALHGLDIRDARVGCVDGVAVDELWVESTFGIDIPWDRVIEDVRSAVAGSLAIKARLAERANSYPARPVTHTLPPDIRIISDDDAPTAIVEVVGPNSLGLLYRLSGAFVEFGLDITRAMVTTVGHDVVDVFYVEDPGSFDLTNERSREELRLALLYALDTAP